jgi:hypothetical protein
MIDRTKQCMTGPFMEAGARRLLPLIDKYQAELGAAILELGPNLHPLVTPERYGGRIVYLELSEPCIAALRERFRDAPSVAIVPFDLEDAWKDGENRLRLALAELAPCFGAIIVSQVLNYIDHREVLRACAEIVAPGALVFVNNVMNHGGDWMFHARRPQSWEELVQDAAALGFHVVEEVSEPAGVRDPTKVRRLGVLRAR